jgi:predicted ATPase
VWFVGLASLSDPELVRSALGTALGVQFSGANPVQWLTAWLRDKAGLIVLDSCEHLVDAAAAVLKAAPSTSILTTSREPLRADGEALHHLAALELPSSSVNLAASDALRYSAVSCLTSARWRLRMAFPLPMMTCRQFWRFVAGSTAFRWPSNWQRRELMLSEFAT